MTNLVILDASGSMNSMKDEVIGSLVQLFITMRETKAQHNIVVDFSGSNDIRTLVNTNDVSELKEELAGAYKPRAATALYDAIGYAFDLVPKKEKKVFVTIITDGEENDSKVYDNNDIKKLIAKKKKAGWAILFTGTTEKDATSVGLKDQYRGFSAGDKTSYAKMMGKSGYSGYSGASGYSGYSGFANFLMTAYASTTIPLSSGVVDTLFEEAEKQQNIADASGNNNVIDPNESI
jgi:hypothetical protein